MTKRVHTIVSWILAASLIWLPFSVLAEFSTPLADKDSCHEMDSKMLDHSMSVRRMPLVKVSQTAEVAEVLPDNVVHESMTHKDCCESGCVACVGDSPCSHSTHHVSAAIFFSQYSSQVLAHIRFSIEPSIYYYNQIITPDFRPPIV